MSTCIYVRKKWHFLVQPLVHKSVCVGGTYVRTYVRTHSLMIITGFNTNDLAITRKHIRCDKNNIKVFVLCNTERKGLRLL